MGLPERYSTTVQARDPRHGPRAIHPNLILVIRFLLTALVCGLALITTIMCLLVVVYYNSHDPIVRPSWGSLIFLIILGFFTCIIYFGYNIFLPLMPFIHYGGFLYSIFMVKIELLLQFVMCVLWVSGALAYAADLRGYENCIFDGYLHYPEPDDFNHVCDLINWAVPLAYATFGVQVLLWFLETVIAMYIFLLLDQEVLSEPHFMWGRRAYDWYHNSPRQNQNGTGNNYRARAVGAGAAGAAGGAALGARNGGRGRRGAAYSDPEAYSDERTDPSVRSSELMEEEEMTETDGTSRGGPLSLGRRGRRGYADEETGYTDTGYTTESRGGGKYDDEYDDQTEATTTRAGTGRRGSRIPHEEEGWHLRE